MRCNSIHNRLLVGASMVLVVFLGITGYVLDRSFRDAARTALEQRLESHIYALLAVVRVSDGGKVDFPDTLPEPRLRAPGSGLYAQVSDDEDHVLWLSPSLLGNGAGVAIAVEPGTWLFRKTLGYESEELLTSAFGIIWELGADNSVPLTFSVAESTASLHAQVSDFRADLWGGLALATLALLFFQGLFLRWSLKPLRQVADELHAMENGQSEALQGGYPDELQPLTENLNALIIKDRKQVERYRDSLSDLAHNLKTPLAVIRSTQEGEGDPFEAVGVIDAQIDRMNEIIEHQLKRAATVGRPVFSHPVRVYPLVEKVVSALERLHKDRAIACLIDIAEECSVRCDEGDLIELLGNVLDNAFKWASSQVRVSAHINTDSLMHRELTLIIEDNGPGMESTDLEHLIRRGARGDDRIEGHGVGLATVMAIIQTYHGHLSVSCSNLGGARISILLQG